MIIQTYAAVFRLSGLPRNTVTQSNLIREHAGNIVLKDKEDEEDIAQIVRQVYGPGLYVVDIIQIDHQRAARVKGSVEVSIYHTQNRNKIHPPLPPAKQPLPNNPSSHKKRRRAAPKKAEVSKKNDPFTTAISGGLFEKDIEEP